MGAGLRQLVAAAVIAACLLSSAADLAAQGRARGRGAAPVPAARGRADRIGPALQARRLPRAYQEPAFAQGYSAGYDRGQADGRRRSRYDPVDNREYRTGDAGYAESYGSRDAYRANYRAGFRQGYEDGYRAATR